jgi:hypothetical protein
VKHTPERIILCVWPNDAVHVEDAADEPTGISRKVWRAWYVRADVVERLEARVRELESENMEFALLVREERMGSDS